MEALQNSEINWGKNKYEVLGQELQTYGENDSKLTTEFAIDLALEEAIICSELSCPPNHFPVVSFMANAETLNANEYVGLLRWSIKNIKGDNMIIRGKELLTTSARCDLATAFPAETNVCAGLFSEILEKVNKSSKSYRFSKTNTNNNTKHK